MRSRFFLPGLCLPVLAVLIGACTRPPDKTPDGRTIVTYWEKWTGFEAAAMKAVVDSFNRMQDSIWVDMMTTSNIDRKVLVATAGADPPDIAGLFSFNIAAYVDNFALTPLDEYMQNAGIGSRQYVDAYIQMCRYRGHYWGLPTTPSSIALHWNKTLFREAGLDPEKPPQTLGELDSMAARLTKYDEEGNIVQLGFLPGEPGWWPWAWGFWFGGRLWDGDSTVTIQSEPNLAAMRWVASYAQRYGNEQLKKFTGGFGSFSSPQNAFLSGLVAMELQGVWMHNFIEKYAPGMEWGAAPFPSAVPGLDSVTIVEADVLVIPRGARHPDQAFAFIAFVQSRAGMELLCMGQRKHSPLKELSEWFRTTHPHKYLQVFGDLARSPHAFHSPKTGICQEFRREMRVTFDKVRLLEATPEEALSDLQRRLQKSMDRHRRRIARRQTL